MSNKSSEASEFEGFNDEGKFITGFGQVANQPIVIIKESEMHVENSENNRIDIADNSVFKKSDEPRVDSIEENITVIENQENAANSSRINKWKNLRYNEEDDGPFRIVMEVKEKEERGINKITVARMLKTKNFIDKIIDIRKAGRKKVTIYLKDRESANELLNSSQLFEPKYVLYLPIFFIVIKGVISGIPVDMTEDEINEELISDYDVLDLYRMSRYVNGKRVEADKICVSFRAKALPNFVKICYLRSRVDPFVSKVIHCHKCLRFNHKADNCKSKSRCKNCGKQNCEAFTNNEECKSKTYCVHCKVDHKVFEKGICNEIDKQKTIKKIMTSRAVSYIEVRDEFDFFTQNKFSVIEEVVEPIKIFEEHAKNRTDKKTMKSHKIITKSKKKQQVEEDEIKIQGRKRVRNEDEATEIAGVALDNPLKVTELEKTIYELKMQMVGMIKSFNENMIYILTLVTKEEDRNRITLHLKNLQGSDMAQQIS